MESKLNSTPQKNINHLYKPLTKNNLTIQKEESNIYTLNNNFKTIYMYIPNKKK
jgi:hypothetical protein